MWRKMDGNETNTVLHIKFSKMLSKRMDFEVCSLVHVLSGHFPSYIFIFQVSGSKRLPSPRVGISLYQSTSCCFKDGHIESHFPYSC